MTTVLNFGDTSCGFTHRNEIQLLNEQVRSRRLSHAINILFSCNESTRKILLTQGQKITLRMQESVYLESD